MTRPKVLLLGSIDHAHDAWNSLSEYADTVKPEATSRAEFIQECKSGRLDGVVGAYRTFVSVGITGIWDEELVQALPEGFRWVVHNGAGYDQLRIPPLSNRRIIACNVPTAVDDATADTALFLLIGALRNFNTSLLALREGSFRGNPAPALGHDPRGKLLGIIGMGGIGQNFARKAQALGMKIAYTKRTRLDETTEKELDATYMDMDTILQKSDVLSVHVPLNDSTRNLLDAATLARTKKGVVIVNTARGGVIDEAALVDALQSGQVGAVGLDVYAEEPKVHPGLVANPRALLLPHMGTWTVETQTTMEEWCVGNLKSALQGKQQWGKMSVVGEQKELFREMIASS